ncbi:efflux RND transporter periplasmic adaptor subunit [Marivibrio halodurans]|uniref:Efflux RND transporter periplasmic adaptor subunit n=1 Tax=Marivibrio halodurans TaxID=2039722 RepID=A0A8J7S3H1_9PROT|nr:efflux RND transporter periplasmic adaptor subunit [Marivibrio halodurans]MBP5855999.1 efflux RND transporter periplasmic adaptor subunit [Marivibrio halodurans]
MIRSRFLIVAALAANLVLGTITPSAAQQQGAGGPQPVTVTTLEARDVTLTSRLPGRIVASGVAEVRPQVAGIITERLFEEGGRVMAGDPMYRIDAESYEASVAAAEAQVAEARARLRATSKEADRAQELIDRGVVSEQRLEEAISQRDVDAAALKVAEAELRAARIDLDRTTIRAKLSGVVGRSFTTQGALVTASQAEPLAVIRALDPVYVDVTQSAAEILAWRRGSVQSKLDGVDTRVTLQLADGELYTETGEMTAAEPHVNESTGVVTLRMTFANPDGLLLPGMYVQVDMPQRQLKDAILAPQQGVQRNRRGEPVAYVVGAENKVEERALTIAQAQGANWVVTDGLSHGDKLIIEGLQKIAPGAPVAPEEGKATTADSSLQ